jgi:type VI secretion system protein ImpF
MLTPGHVSTDRLPSLLDRLTDDDPGETKDAYHKRVASTAQLRESVVRDLGWLLNSVQLSAVQDLSSYPYAQRSVLNYGLPDLAGRTASGIDAVRLEAELRQAILDYEPRLLPRTVVVTVGSGEVMHNSLQLTIEAELSAHPAPLALCLRTEIDLENGEVNMVDLGKPHGA